MYEVVFTLVCACSGTSTHVHMYYVCVSAHVWIFICVCVCAFMCMCSVCVCVHLPRVNCLPDNYFDYSFSKALSQTIYSLMLTKKQIAIAIRSLQT